MQESAEQAIATQDEQRELIDLDELQALGVVISIEGSQGFPLQLDSLERLSRHRATPRRPQWLLLSVAPETEDSSEVALVWVSDEYRQQFLKLFEDFVTRDTKSGKPWNAPLISNMSRIRATVLRDLWQSADEPPATGEHWWEVWLRPSSDAVSLAREFSERAGLRMAPSHLFLDSRHVVWIRASWVQLQALPFTAVPVTELRRPQFVDAVGDLDVDEQVTLVDDLAGRVQAAPAHAPAVCLLDTGVRRTHLLIEPSLAASDVHSVVGQPAGDVQGHGTRMAGLALFGPVDDPLTTNATIKLRHRLESVKYLPDTGMPAHDPRAFGVVTAEAIALPEVAVSRARAYCLTITRAADRPGEPSLWSAATDALAAGTDISTSPTGVELLGPPDRNAARLILVSAGNVDSYHANYRDNCDLSPIEDPAQAWNALTVGACTSLQDTPSDPSYAGWTPLATAGDVSPHTRTGVSAGGDAWPIKPEICIEGGNVLTDGAGDFDHNHPVLSLATTDARHDNALSCANATSAATAQASRLAALAMATYPSYWPETVRGLLTHSAAWTDTMKSEIAAETQKKRRVRLLRRYGWGVPDEQAVLSSTANSVTLVTQDEFVPFTGKDFHMRSFRLHELPWPAETLSELGAAEIELRVTLSYFIEPSAARRGWRRRYSYASHGLRFELRAPNETTPEFVRRINREATVEEGDGAAKQSSGTSNWLIGPNQRNRGSLHQDIWYGDGPQLASTGGVLAVHAVGGWWKNNSRKDRADLPIRYALLVSLRTKGQEVDLYTPIATALAVPVEAAVIEV